MEKDKGTIVLIGNHHIVIYNFRKELIQRLLSENYRVVVLMPCTKEAEKIKALGCELIDIPVDRRGMNPIRDGKLLIRYWKALKRLHPQAVFTYTIKPNIYGCMACRLLHLPYICTITGVGKGVEQGGILTQLVFFMYRIAMKNVHKIFFQNQQDKAIFEKSHVGKGKYRTVSGSGVNLQSFSLKPFPDESDNLSFLFVARIDKLKGINEYLEAATVIKKKYPLTEFHILGFWEENYKEKIETLVKQGIVIYDGMQEDVVPFLAKSQCLIHPSFLEGMSNACLEAAATGRAVIASDIPGCRECVEDGETGYLFPPGNVKELIEKIEKFIALPYNERKRMGELGRKKMETEFSREQVVNAYMEELKNIVNREEE